MTIDWGALGTVFGVSVGLTVALVGLFTLGMIALSRREAAGSAGSSAAVSLAGAAYGCFALCAAAVGFGIHLIVA